MTDLESVFCLDTNVLIKVLVNEDPIELNHAADAILTRALDTGLLIAPAFAWVEVGSTLRKHVRQGIINGGEAETLWIRFSELPITFLDSPRLRDRAWELADRYRLPNLYDAAFLACIETFGPSRALIREFWTADEVLLRALSDDPLPFVRRLQVL